MTEKVAKSSYNHCGAGARVCVFDGAALSAGAHFFYQRAPPSHPHTRRQNAVLMKDYA